MNLLDEIRSLSSALVASRDAAAIAESLSVGRTRVVQKLGGIGLVMETLGPQDGAALLDTLEAQSASVPALKWAWVLVNRGELDFGSPVTRTMISELIPNPARSLLLSVAEVPDPVTPAQVEVAMKNDNGTYK